MVSRPGSQKLYLIHKRSKWKPPTSLSYCLEGKFCRIYKQCLFTKQQFKQYKHQQSLVGSFQIYFHLTTSSTVSLAQFAVTSSSCVPEVATYSLNSVTRRVTSPDDLLTCSLLPSPTQNKAELDLLGTTRNDHSWRFQERTTQKHPQT